jgi:hypothetical protein
MTAVVGVWLALPATVTAAENFAARLTTVPIDPTTRATTTGRGSATAVLDGARLTLSGSFTGMQGAATVARLHAGRATGVRGPALADFTVPAAPSGSFSAELTLTPEQVEELRRGHVYIQIHSASAPDGNLWGWLLQ